MAFKASHLFFIFMIHLASGINISDTNIEENATEIIDLASEDFDGNVSYSGPDAIVPAVPVPEKIIPTLPITQDDLDKNPSMFYCSCDLYATSCDVNCCCDPDCTEQERKVFSECLSSGQRPHRQTHCYRSTYFFRYNSDKTRKTSSSSDSYFCILYDNLKERHFYEQVPALETESSFSNAKTPNLYFWEKKTPSLLPKISVMKVGAPIKIFSSIQRNFSIWSLPRSLFSSWCEGRFPVSYLTDFKSACLRNISDSYSRNSSNSCSRHGVLGANAYYKGRKVLKNLAHHANITSNVDLLCSQKNVCIPFTVVSPYKVCEEKNTTSWECTEVNGKIPDPVVDNRVCRNAVKNVRYMVEHSGIGGIVAVHVFFELTNVNISSPLLQGFAVKFSWVNKSLDSFSRSGNPGYITGLPVAVGSQGQSSVLKNQTFLIEDFQPLTVVGANIDGSCDLNHSSHVRVNFKHNLHSGCSLQIPLPSNRSCHFLRCLASKQLFIHSEANYVASFGDFIVKKESDWIKIQFHNKPVLDFEETQKGVCSNVPHHLDIQIAYAATHTVDDPQQRIVGARLVFHIMPTLKLECAPETCQIYVTSLSLTTSVSFKKISQSPVVQFGKPPHIKGNLQDDFFYPFLTGASDKSHFVPQNVCFSIKFVVPHQFMTSGLLYFLWSYPRFAF